MGGLVRWNWASISALLGQNATSALVCSKQLTSFLACARKIFLMTSNNFIAPPGVINLSCPRSCASKKASPWRPMLSVTINDFNDFNDSKARLHESALRRLGVRHGPADLLRYQCESGSSGDAVHTIGSRALLGQKGSGISIQHQPGSTVYCET